MINVICTVVEITFWEMIDPKKREKGILTQLLHPAVSPADGFGIYLFVHRVQVQRLLLSQLCFPHCLQGLAVV